MEDIRQHGSKKIGYGELVDADIGASYSRPCMHHRALRLIHTPAVYSSHASPLTFSAILQAAAGRAWTRSTTTACTKPTPTAHDNSPQKAPQAPVSSIHSLLTTQIPAEKYASRTNPSPEGSSRAAIHTEPIQSNPLSSTPSYAVRPAKFVQQHSVTYFDVRNVQDSDFEPTDPVNPDDHCLALPSRYPPLDASITNPLQGSRKPRKTKTPLAPLSTSASALCQNIMYVISRHNPPPSLPSLLDYHDLHPGLRSTRSYNLLLARTLRHASYGTFEWLLAAMCADSLSGDLETRKLKARWLIQSGWWTKAWEEVTARQSVTIGQPNNSIPLPIWLEFFRTLKRGTIRRRRARARLEDAEVDSCAAPEVLTEPHESVHLYTSRYRVLMDNQPTFTPQELSLISPRAIYSIVLMMLKSGQRDTALLLTKTYFTNLPAKISTSWARTCVDIIHLHIALGSVKKGLGNMYESRRTLVLLLRLRRDLRPTSTTLFLLLAPLRQAKRCGTVAWNIFQSSTRNWGAALEDRRVRRRVAQLAAKEGRWDIVDRILRSERLSRWAHATWKLTRRVVGEAVTSPKRLLRPPARKLFTHNGREQMHWCRFIKQVQRMKRRMRQHNRK